MSARRAARRRRRAASRPPESTAPASRPVNTPTLPWPPFAALAHQPLADDELRLCWRPHGDEPPQARRARVDQVLRAALAPTLGLVPEALRFGREARGRPFLQHPGAPDFNLSDTEGGTLVAIAVRGRVGVDLERIDRRPPVARLARRYFAADEVAALAALAEEPARLAFLQLWTAKEASCKATGTGIFGWLPRWRFSLQDAATRLLEAPADAGAMARWTHLRLAPSPAHTAVLALRDGDGLHLRAGTLAP